MLNWIFGSEKKITIKSKDFSHTHTLRYSDICKAFEMIWLLVCIFLLLVLMRFLRSPRSFLLSGYESIFTWEIVFFSYSANKCFSHANHKPMQNVPFHSCLADWNHIHSEHTHEKWDAFSSFSLSKLALFMLTLLFRHQLKLYQNIGFVLCFVKIRTNTEYNSHTRVEKMLWTAGRLFAFTYTLFTQIFDVRYHIIRE